MKNLVDWMLRAFILAMFAGAMLAAHGCEGREVSYPTITPTNAMIGLEGSALLAEDGTPSTAKACSQVDGVIEWKLDVAKIEIPVTIKICEVIVAKEGDVHSCLLVGVETIVPDSAGVKRLSASGLIEVASSDGCKKVFHPFRYPAQPLAVAIGR